MQWNENFETGIEKIDSQHRELFRKLDQLELDLYSGRAKLEIQKMIGFLEDYINTHFDDEEKIMLDAGVQEFGKHREQHKNFMQMLRDFKIEFEKKGADSYLAIRLDKELRSWWENHILKTDKLYISRVKK
ncbi:MAG: hemerythrin family protein [Spirochaetes bacterium]|nr:hemerythrin family protein [Spirochaetota bacterium]